VKVPVSWLRDLVDVPVAPQALAHDLHMTGFEVASVEGDDPVIDFEITANRPDCLSLVGLAREVATKYGTALRAPGARDLGPSDPSALGPLRVVVEDPVRCPRYCAALADVRVGPSPAWLAARLTAAGIRAINNIVDVTNYVLLELGHPLHAFDLATLAGPALHIRTARPGETLTTLDGQPRTLDGDMLVIADASRAQALAGVMGGRASEVSDTTTAIVLESAWFEPTSIRRTSKRLGLSTEASYRFERGADFAAAAGALARAGHLIEEIGAGTVRAGWIDARAQAPAPRVVHLAHARIGAVLGAEVSADEIRRILTGLGFVLADAGDGRTAVSVPSWRVDVSREVDLIEEVARHYGYDRLPATFPALAQVPSRPDPRLEQDRGLRRLATAAGFSECVTFSFISEKAAREFADADALVGITNPLSELFAVLRPSLLPGLVDAVAHNRRHGQRDVRLFELGTRFLRPHGESRTLSLAWSGAAVGEHWSGGTRSADLFDVTGVVETLARALGLTAAFRAAEHPALTPGRTAEVLASGPEGPPRVIGVAGRVRSPLTTARDIPPQDDVYVAEIDLEAAAGLVAPGAVTRTRPLPRFPSIVRDLSILVDETLLAADVRGTIQAVAPATLVRVGEFDRYQGKGIAEGKVSLSYRLTFQAPDRTLTDAEAEAAMTAIVEALATRHGAARR
jgi:phenylalanyl-tRNA synthetase beta chain